PGSRCPGVVLLGVLASFFCGWFRGSGGAAGHRPLTRGGDGHRGAPGQFGAGGSGGRGGDGAAGLSNGGGGGGGGYYGGGGGGGSASGYSGFATGGGGGGGSSYVKPGAKDIGIWRGWRTA